MSYFHEAVETVLKHEGGFVDHPHDPGGATNYGISLRTLRAINDDTFDVDSDGDFDSADIEGLSRKFAIEFYNRHFWRSAYEDFPSQELATKVFDMAVNMGTKQAHKILQRASNNVEWARTADGNVYLALHVDGAIGPKTLERVNSQPETYLLHALRAECAKLYFNLVEKRPERRKVFLLGWLRRAYS